MEDYLIAASENTITLLTINDKKIFKKDEKTFEVDEDESLLVHLFNGLLYVSDHKKLMVFEVNKQHLTFFEVHSVKIDKKILKISGLNERETIVAFKDETLVYSVPNKKFVETVCKNPPCRKLLMVRKSAE